MQTELDKKPQPKNIFSITVAKDFRIQTKIVPKNHLNVETSDLDFDSKNFGTAASVKLNNHLSPSVMKFRKTCNLLSTPKLTHMGKINAENKFERIFMSIDKHSSKFDEEENEDQLTKKLLNDSGDLEVEDIKPKEYVGLNAINSYYSYYKKLDKIVDKNKISPSTKGFLFVAISIFFMSFISYIFLLKLLYYLESSYTAMLSKIESDCLLPTKLGVIKYMGDENKVKIKYVK